VRGCGLPLAVHGHVLLCTRGHSFDMARAGYVNLLQPQDRKSPTAGDSPDAVEARHALLVAGVGRRLLDRVSDAAASRLPTSPAVVDLGAGTGALLAGIASRVTIDAIGIDLSVAAMTHAARTHPTMTWIVANADRRLPLRDGCIDLIVSMHGRRNPAECARVIASTGVLMVIVPAADDLRELRSAIGSRGIEADRVPGVIADYEGTFTLAHRSRLEEHHRLERPVLRLLLRATYRGERHSAATHVESLETLDVTLASDLLVFDRR
jgi:23S rRNA (guanine745-N1)-methyltransferase